MCECHLYLSRSTKCISHRDQIIFAGKSERSCLIWAVSHGGVWVSVLAPTVPPPPPPPHPNHFSGQKYKNTDPKVQKSTLRIVRVSVIVLRGAPLTGRPRYAPHYYSSVCWGAPIMTPLPLPDNHFFTHLLNSAPILSFQHIWRKERGLLLFRELRTVREQMERGSIFKKFASNTKYEGGRAKSKWSDMFFHSECDLRESVDQLLAKRRRDHAKRMVC